jgi:hypothetical protein
MTTIGTVAVDASLAGSEAGGAAVAFAPTIGGPTGLSAVTIRSSVRP